MIPFQHQHINLIKTAIAHDLSSKDIVDKRFLYNT